MNFKQWKIWAIFMGVLLLFFCLPGYSDVLELVNANKLQKTLVIDPGHGGQDSGALSPNNTMEKNINLEISLALKKEAEKKGYKVIMTRKEDTGLISKEDNGKWSKLGDMKERVKIIKDANPSMVISIHLNSFIQDKTVKGAQVFFPNKEDKELSLKCKTIAENVQSELKKGINDGSDRQAMEKENLFIFREINNPIILVECGFLSNETDENNLKIAKFQQKIAVYIIRGIEKRID